ncbi:MAG: hypothetical protein QY325_07045 [Flavobacteriales bacterium]|jgi:hypothetical protein|nr:MAG: hypothetical protein QY325_07045 [Flavobacteriales bacterium]
MVLALLTALAVIALRLILHTIGAPPQGTDFMLVHFLAIVTIVFFIDMRLLRRNRAAGFPDLMREGFKGAALYALLLMAYLWFHYTAIEDDAFSKRIEAMVLQAVEEGQPERIVRPRLTRFFTPFNYASISFFALLATGAFNALLIGAIHHKLLRRAMR